MQLPGNAQSPTLPARYIWGATIVWVAIWIGTAVVLKSGGTFADMIPILTVGTGWFMTVVPGSWPPPSTAAQATAAQATAAQATAGP